MKTLTHRTRRFASYADIPKTYGELCQLYLPRPGRGTTHPTFQIRCRAKKFPNGIERTLPAQPVEFFPHRATRRHEPTSLAYVSLRGCPGGGRRKTLREPKGLATPEARGNLEVCKR